MIKPWSVCRGLLSGLILLAGVHGITFAQQVARELSGTVYSADSITPLSRVSILNTRSRQLTISNPIGNFSILVTEGDTLTVSSIGFAALNIPVSELSSLPGKARIIMKSSVYELKPVNIAIRRIPKIDHEYYQKIFSRPKPSALTSPISALYDRFNKKAISLRKLEFDYYEYEYQKLEMSRFRNAIFPIILEDLEMYSLIEHCRLSRSFVRNAIDYDFIFAVRECMKTFPAPAPGSR